MELGQRLRAARLEAGLSQRQLCGDEITRNMLSQIENGSARPSMDTLRYLAGRLGKPMSYFLEEEAAVSPNQAAMEQARLACLMKEDGKVLQALESYREPDEIFDQEYRLLSVLGCLNLARTALEQGRRPYALELLERAEEMGKDCVYCGDELERRRILLAAKADPYQLQRTVGKLPSLDEELQLRARAALDAGDAKRCGALLEAAEEKSTADWNYLRGEAYLAERKYRDAAACYHRAESACPEKVAPRLELCYRELEDYKMAYLYACRQR